MAKKSASGLDTQSAGRSTGLSGAPLPTTSRSAGFWWMGLLLAFLGTALAFFAADRQAAADAQFARTLQGVRLFQAQVTQYAGGVRQAVSAPGQITSTDLGTLRSAQASASQTIGALQAGGTLDGIGSLAPLGAPASAGNAALAVFNQATAPFQAALPDLDALATATEAYTDTHGKVMTLLATARQSPRLAQGTWGTALATVSQDLSAALTPSATTLPLVQRRAQDLQRFRDLAAADPAMSAGDRIQLANAASQAAVLMQQAQVQAAGLAKVAPLNQQVLVVAQAQDALRQALGQLVGAAVRATPLPTWRTLSWVGLALVVAGLLWAWLATQSIATQAAMTNRETARSRSYAEALERLSRELRKILTLETANRKITLSPDSPAFGLASGINQVLASREDGLDLVERQAGVLARVQNDIEGMFQATQERQVQVDRQVASSHLGVGHFSGAVDLVVDSLGQTRQAITAAVEQSSRILGLSQDAVWKLDAVRENTQGSGKRLKRLAESAQAISETSESVLDVGRQAKVLALNIAVEAASRGDDGRVFAGLAKELERLAAGVDTAVRDIHFQVDAIMEDSRDAIGSMERGVSDIVDCAKVSNDGSASARDLMDKMRALESGLGQTATDLSAAASGIRGEQDQMAESVAGVSEMAKLLASARERAQVLRAAVSEFRGWLSPLGRDA